MADALRMAVQALTSLCLHWQDPEVALCLILVRDHCGLPGVLLDMVGRVRPADFGVVLPPGGARLAAADFPAEAAFFLEFMHHAVLLVVGLQQASAHGGGGGGGGGALAAGICV